MPIPFVSWIPRAGIWLWNKIRGRPTVQADRGAVAAGRDQVVKDSVIAAEQALRGEMGALVAAIQHFHGPVTIINAPRYEDGLPQASPRDVRDAYREGRRLQDIGDHIGAIRQFERAFAAAEEDAHRCALHIMIGWNFGMVDRFAEADGHLLEALDLARRGGQPEAEGVALWGLGLTHFSSGNLEEAETYNKQALDILQRHGQQSLAAGVAGLLGVVHRRQGRLDEAERRLTEALSVFERLDHQEGQALCLGSLANVYHDRDAFDREEELDKRALEIYENLGDSRGRATTLYNLGLVYDSHESRDDAEQCFVAASGLFAAYGDIVSQARALNRAGRISRDRGDHQAALERCSTAQLLFEGIGDEEGRAEALGILGTVYLSLHDPDNAARLLAQALAAYRGLNEQRDEAFMTVFLGFALFQRLDLAGAEEKIREAKDLFCRAGEPGRADQLGTIVQSLEELKGIQDRLAAAAPRQPEAKPKRSRRPRKKR